MPFLKPDEITLGHLGRSIRASYKVSKTAGGAKESDPEFPQDDRAELSTVHSGHAKDAGLIRAEES